MVSEIELGRDSKGQSSFDDRKHLKCRTTRSQLILEGVDVTEEQPDEEAKLAFESGDSKWNRWQQVIGKLHGFLR